MIPFNLSKDLSHTWFVDLDGTVLDHNGHLTGQEKLLPGVKEFWEEIPPGDHIVITTGRAEEYRESTLAFLDQQGLRYDTALFGLPLGERIVINDDKPGGLKTAMAWNVKRNKGFFYPSKILLLSHTHDFKDHLDLCENFDQVFTYNIKRALEKQDIQVRAISAQKWLGTKRKEKSKFSVFLEEFDTSLLDEYTHVLFVGAVPTKIIHQPILDFLHDRVSGVVGEFNEYPKNPNTDVVFHALPVSAEPGCVYVGPMYDSNELYPDQEYEDTLVLHIDHHYPGRTDCFEQIRQLILDLPNNAFYQANWKNLEIWYHSQQITLEQLETIDFYRRPPNIPFRQLAKIYRRTHMAFLSHRETLGMYPVELMASGAMVACLDREFLTEEMHSLVRTVGPVENFWNHVLPLINKVQANSNSQSVAACSYDNGIKKVLDTLEHIHRFKKQVKKNSQLFQEDDSSLPDELPLWWNPTTNKNDDY